MLTFFVDTFGFNNSSFCYYFRKKEGKRKNRYFDIAAAIEDGKINDLNDVQKRHLIDNLSPTPNFKFPVQTFSDKS